MMRVSTSLLALGFGLVSLLGIADDANARVDCVACGAGTTRIYRTIHPLVNVTRYHDRAVYHRVTRLHYVVAVTRIQPIVHVNDVTRLHHFTIVQDAYADQPQQPLAGPDEQALPVNAFGAGCACVYGE